MYPEQLIIKPVVTEKAVGTRRFSCYVFKVHLDATKIAIQQAVEKLFKVKVKSVNTCKVRSKTRMRGRHVGRTAQWKKAYVTLKTDQKIEELEI